MEEERKERTTDPAPPPSKDVMFDDMQEKLANLWAAHRDMHELLGILLTRSDGISNSLQDIQASLAAAWANGTLATEHLRPLGVRIGELEARMDNLEQRIRDSQTEVT